MLALKKLRITDQNPSEFTARYCETCVRTQLCGAQHSVSESQPLMSHPNVLAGAYSPELI
jgi:hypothetical protein